MPHAYDYFIRITYPYQDIASLVSKWALQCEKLIVYQHTGEKTEKIHCHMVMIGSRIQKKQLRNLGNQFVNLKGNENCSFKEAIDDGAITYMSKGNLEPSYNKGFAEERIEELRKKWVKPKDHVRENPMVQLYNELYGDVDYLTLQLNDEYNALPEDMTPDQKYFKALSRYTRKYLFCKNQFIWDPATINKYKTLVYSYCFRNNIYIPNDIHSIWKNY